MVCSSQGIAGDIMSQHNRKISTSLFLVALMLFAPLAAASSVSTFANGESEVDVELRDGSEYLNTIDGEVDLPAGETVTGASLEIATKMIEHSSSARIDVDTIPRVWNPQYNNQLTIFSDIDDFQIEDGSQATPVSLKSEGFLTDFEGTSAGFMDMTMPPPMSGLGWEHGSLFGNTITNSNCSSGTDCWGTNVYDENYTDDNGAQPFDLTMNSVEMFVNPQLKSHTAHFASWHNLEAFEQLGTTVQNKPMDCAYVEIRSSLTGNFPPDSSGFAYIPIDIGASSGVSYSNGYWQKSNSGANNKIGYQCGGIPTDEYGLADKSTSTSNPSGWADLALNLTGYVGKYIQLRFIMEHQGYNPATGWTVKDYNTSGWYIDDFRLGELLPQSGEMTIRGFLPSTLGGDNHPNGFGVLNLESETTTSGTIEVDIVDSTNGQDVIDNNGKSMTGLSGKIIELWDVNSTTYPSINLKFRFDSGPSRLSSPVLHGIGLGTRVGTGFNQTSVGMNTIVNGVWESPGLGEPMIYTPSVIDESFTVDLQRMKFNRPITSITPIIQDDCPEDPSIEAAFLGVSGVDSLSNNVQEVLTHPIFGFTTMVSYTNSCNIGGIWFDLTFGHHADRVQIDVAHDGDIDWGFDEPAFGYFGRQTTLWNNKADGVNYGANSKEMFTDLSGTAQGGHFMLPKGSVVSAADVAFDDVTIHSNTDPNEGFDLYLVSGTQEISLGTIGNMSVITSEGLSEVLDLENSLNSLLTNPMVPTSHVDEYGNEWMTFFFKATSPNASTGASMTVKGLDIVYDFSTTINNGDGLDSELNQGIALWSGEGHTGPTATVSIAVSSDTGGGVTLSDLSVSTSTGYDNTISLNGDPVGLYPNGDIYEIVTTHTVDPLTGSTLAEATLSFESKTGNVVLSYSEFLGFSEASDEDNLVTLESSSYTDITNGKEVIWRFRVNPSWEDTETVRIYSGLIAGNGVNGLPDALLMAPVGGNAVENDAGITSFSLQNSIGTIQDLDDGMSNQEIKLVGSIRLQDLDASPDPTSYYMTLELRHINNTDGNVTTEWEEVANQSGVIGGDFDWTIDLGSTAAGEETYRFKIDGYEGGDTLCPSLSLRPDAECAIPFNLTIDTYDPNLINMQVLNGQVDPNVDSNWRTLVDDTWVVPSATQKIRMQAQDLPNPPENLELHIWVEHDHDSNDDGMASADEYISITLTSDGEVPNSNYSGEYNDYANEGQDPVGKVSLWVEGFDLAGNPIDGGAPGFENDYVTYVSMSSKNPIIRNFFIDDSTGNRFINSNQAAIWEGDWNQTMYAGNEYHLIVEAGDDNGWRDVDYIRVDLDDSREDMTLWYFPRNETAWTDSQWIDIIEEDADNEGPRLLRMDGGHLVDTFESNFYLDLPIRIDWGVLGEGNTLNTPVLYMQDLDNPRYRMLPVSGRHIQSWFYSDGIQLDFRTDEANDLMITPVFTDESEPFTADVRKGFVYPGDIVSFTGQYAYVDGIYDSVYIKPEVEMTLKVIREDAQMNGAKGYIAYPGETFYHNFTGGEFTINITAPPVTNDYRYTFELIDLPNGAIDTTSGLCSSSSSFGCASFNIKVDSNSPRVATNSWTAKKGATGELLEGFISTANYHCIDVEVIIEEQEALFPGDVQVAWKFFDDPANDIAWGKYRSTHGSDEMTATLDLLPTGGSYFATADCIDLWPLEEGQYDPAAEDIIGVEVIFWIEGVDSAGSQIILGGGPQEDGSVGHMVSGEVSHKSIYNFIHEAAKFDVLNVKMNPSNPTVGQKPILEVEIRNTGTMSGSASLIIKSVINDGIPAEVGLIETDVLAIGESDWFTIELEAFPSATTGMYYIIVNNESSENMFDGSVEDKFNVKVQEASDSGSMALILAIVGIIAIVLLGLVVILIKRGQDGGGSSSELYDDEYEDEAEGKAYAELPSHNESPAANVDPTMAKALETFPQWSQAEIQGYFDQGWSIEALQDWVKNQ